MPFGLSVETLSKITATLSSNKLVTKLVLFGSRAKGNPKPGSDIDIAVIGSDLSLDNFLNFSLQIERLEIAQKVDLVDYFKINNQDLLDHIERVGVILYENGQIRKYGLPPVIDQDSKILILGTFPSEKSLEMKQYYANPANKFWEIMSAVLNENCPVNYEFSLQMLKKHRIALWDVLASCLRDGSGDKAIRGEIPNNIKKLIDQYPGITHIFYNGRNPAIFWGKFRLEEGKAVPVPFMPCTSGLNTHLTVADKIDRWKTIRYIPGIY